MCGCLRKKKCSCFKHMRGIGCMLHAALACNSHDARSVPHSSQSPCYVSCPSGKQPLLPWPLTLPSLLGAGNHLQIARMPLPMKLTDAMKKTFPALDHILLKHAIFDGDTYMLHLAVSVAWLCAVQFYAMLHASCQVHRTLC